MTAQALTSPLSLVPASTNVVALSQKLQAVESYLNTVLLEREQANRSLLVTILSGQNMVLVGEPGTGKSMLLSEVSRCIVENGAPLSNLFYLMTAYTTPEEIFGPYCIDAAKFAAGTYERNLTGRLAGVRLGLLDEVFRANSAVSNALLGVLSDRVFTNGINKLHVPLLAMIGASNSLPQGSDLAAFADRWSKKTLCRPLSEEGLATMLERAEQGWQAPAPATIDLDEVLEARELVKQVKVPASIRKSLVQINSQLNASGVFQSTRRTAWNLRLIQANALIEGRLEANEDDLLSALEDALWGKETDLPIVAQVLAKCVSPEIGMARTIQDNIQIEWAKYQSERASLRGAGLAQAHLDIKCLLEEQGKLVRDLRDQSVGKGQGAEQIERIRVKLLGYYHSVLQEMGKVEF